MTRRSTVVVAAFAALALTALAGAYATSMAAAPTAVAAVDIDAVLNQLAEKGSIEADLQVQSEKVVAEVEARKKKIAELQNGLDMLLDEESRNARQEAIAKAVIDLQAYSQFHQQRLGRESAIQMEKLYRKAVETIGTVATEAGYDLVLYKEAIPNFDGNSPQQVRAQVTIRKVLWTSDAIDLSDQIVTRMNNEFDAGR